jgi:hypothetical protein
MIANFQTGVLLSDYSVLKPPTQRSIPLRWLFFKVYNFIIGSLSHLVFSFIPA